MEEEGKEETVARGIFVAGLTNRTEYRTLMTRLDGIERQRITARPEIAANVIVEFSETGV